MVYVFREHFILSERKEQHILFEKGNGRRRRREYRQPSTFSYAVSLNYILEEIGPTLQT
jgi:hypothetical protein